MTRLITKTTLLFTACSLASALTWADVAPTDANVTSTNTNNSQASTQAKTESGLFTTSVQSQNSNQHQLNLAISKPAATTPVAGNNTATPVINTPSPATNTPAPANPASTNSGANSQTATTSTHVTQSADNNLSQQVLAVSASVDSGVKNTMAMSNKETTAITSAIKNQADFAQATANSVTAHAQTTLASVTENLRDVQTSTSAAMNEAVKSGVTDSINSTTTNVLNQQVANQVNTAVTQEIGKAIQTSVANSLTNSVTQNIGLGL